MRKFHIRTTKQDKLTMPAYTKEHEQELMSKIRQIMVLKPDASCRQIVDVMQQNGRSITKEYVLKLQKKIRGERAHRYDNAAAKEAIAKFEDFVKTMNEELLKLNKETKLDVVKSITISNIVKNYKMVLDFQFDTGVFERKLGKMTIEQINVAEILKAIKDERDAKQNQNRNSNDGGEGSGGLPLFRE